MLYLNCPTFNRFANTSPFDHCQHVPETTASMALLPAGGPFDPAGGLLRSSFPGATADSAAGGAGPG